jgi:hypothetical protein
VGYGKSNSISAVGRVVRQHPAKVHYGSSNLSLRSK